MDDLRFTTCSSVFQSYQEVGMAIVQGLIESVEHSKVKTLLRICICTERSESLLLARAVSKDKCIHYPVYLE